MKTQDWCGVISSYLEPLREEAVSVVRNEDSRRVLALRLLEIQSQALREVLDAGATDHPADIAFAFATSVFQRLCASAVAAKE